MEQNEQEYRAGKAALTHTDSQEELDCAKVPSELLGFDPRGESKRPNYERTSYQPKACSFNQILELWAAHEGGALKRATHVPGQGGEGYGEDDAMRAWEWVARTPGWNPVVHEVMRHLELRRKTWEEWPVAHVELLRPTPHCPWPPCAIPKRTAAMHWGPFFRALRRRYREQPFTIYEQRAELA